MTARTLHLASKNEFLLNLEHEVRQLKSQDNIALGVSSNRISRMIEVDVADDEMWEQFTKEFMILHSDFMDQLVEEFGSFRIAKYD